MSCKKLKSLDLSSLNIVPRRSGANLHFIDMAQMCLNCTNLESFTFPT
jgi:hypothetical protein